MWRRCQVIFKSVDNGEVSVLSSYPEIGEIEIEYSTHNISVRVTIDFIVCSHELRVYAYYCYAFCDEVSGFDLESIVFRIQLL